MSLITTDLSGYSDTQIEFFDMTSAERHVQNKYARIRIQHLLTTLYGEGSESCDLMDILEDIVLEGRGY